MSSGTASAPKASEAQVKWIGKLVSAQPDQSNADRNKLFNGVATQINGRLDEIRAGMSFTIERTDDPQALAAMKKLLGIDNRMKSLTGTGAAMKEIDTEHHRGQLKAISASDLMKAQAALEIVRTASEEARTQLRELRFKDSGMTDAGKREKIEAAVEERKRANAEGRAVPRTPPGISDEEINQFEEIETRVNAEVAEEIWTPLVRQGVMPENLVPENYSNVRRTFDAASKQYITRLEEYTKGLDDNTEMLNKLGVAKSVIDKSATMVQQISGALPDGLKDIKDHVDSAAKLFAIVSDASFKAAEMVIKNEDLQKVFETGAAGIADLCAKAIPDPTIAAIVSSGIKAGSGAGRIIRGLVDGDAEATIQAFANSIGDGFSVATSVTGDKSWDNYGALATKLVLQAGKGSRLLQAVRSGEGIKEAAAEFVQQSMDALNQSLVSVIEHTVKDEGTAKKAKEGIGIGTDLIGAMGKAAVADDKAAAVSAALGAAAKRSCAAYIEPADLGSAIAGLLETGIKNGAPLYKSAKERDLAAVGKTLMSAALDSLAQAANIPGLSDKAKGALKEAAKDVKLAQQAAELAEAVVSGDQNKIEKSATTFFTAFGDKVSAILSKAKVGADDTSGDSSDSGGDDPEGGGGDAMAESAQEFDEEDLKRLRSTIAKASLILNDKNAGAVEKKKAQEDVAAASQALVERKALGSDLGASNKAFAANLSRTYEPNDDPDFEGEDIQSLQELILQIQKDRKVFELVEKLSSLPLQVAAKFFPVTGAALDFKTFTFEVMKAVAHTKQLIEWMDNAADAQSAVSVQAHAMLSRVHCENRQVLEHNMRAALALTAAVGQVVAVAGAHAAPAGVALTAAARGAQTGLEIIKVVVDEVEVQKAWKLFQQALKNPKDRILVRQAIESNPTLAKYTIAWGALQGGDPIARNAMRKCGLTDAVLAKESANVKDVQMYLEEMFKEDVVVLRAMPEKKAWYPAKPSLTLRSWSAFYAAAVDKAKLKPGTGGSVGQAFTELEKSESALRSAQKELKFAKDLFDRETILAGKAAAKEVAAATKKSDIESASTKITTLIEPAPSPILKRAQTRLDNARKSVETSREKLLQALDAVSAAVLKFEPVEVSGNPHVTMREYLDALAAQAELRARELKGEPVALDTAA